MGETAQLGVRKRVEGTSLDPLFVSSPTKTTISTEAIPTRRITRFLEQGSEALESSLPDLHKKGLGDPRDRLGETWATEPEPVSRGTRLS